MLNFALNGLWMVSGFQTADIVPGFFASIAASIYPGQRSIKNNPFVRSGKDPSLRPDPAHDLCGAGGGTPYLPAWRDVDGRDRGLCLSSPVLLSISKSSWLDAGAGGYVVKGEHFPVFCAAKRGKRSRSAESRLSTYPRV
jgi:hypothetical protein